MKGREHLPPPPYYLGGSTITLTIHHRGEFQTQPVAKCGVELGRDDRAESESSESNDSGEDDLVDSQDDLDEHRVSDEDDEGPHYPLYCPIEKYNPTFMIGLEFSTKAEFREAIKSHAIKTRRTLKTTKNDGIRVFCVRHLLNNFKSATFRGLAFKNALWSASYATTVSEFKLRMQQMRALDESAVVWFNDKHPDQWSRSHFSHNSGSCPQGRAETGQSGPSSKRQRVRNNRTSNQAQQCRKDNHDYEQEFEMVTRMSVNHARAKGSSRTATPPRKRPGKEQVCHDTHLEAVINGKSPYRPPRRATRSRNESQTGNEHEPSFDTAGRPVVLPPSNKSGNEHEPSIDTNCNTVKDLDMYPPPIPPTIFGPTMYQQLQIAIGI
ncbi:hypothetical protein BUALT_Bualt04G0089300 [Buddleja alternifolia]|uniref:Transposase MuDR plant domain-containing protein n=1 Tax=Buddleja alternifolia TaxID=168488 RepID=A0AAV6XY74_9LAMI|nr:hypothetical protein BUALT_Bualt04G0089300 [Buddleja alternifolia]